MSLIVNRFQIVSSLLRSNFTSKTGGRFLSTSFVRLGAEETTNDSKNIRDADKDRTKIIPPETSIAYMKSDAYKETYGSDPVWKLYRRNFKGQIPPRKTRKTCIRGGVISTGSPCPICRDEYLVLDYRNVDLLNQFISEHNGDILSYSKTNICQKKHKELIVAVHKARDCGIITFDPPIRMYDYSEWQPSESDQQ